MRSGPRLSLGLASCALLLGCGLALAWRTWHSRAFSVAHPPEELFLRAFKEEAVVEAWGRLGSAPFQLIERFPVLASSGVPGPKRKEGDRQVPEGFYLVDRINPQSRFHLSLGLDYPNASDRLRGDPRQPGSDIFIHGGAASIGCLPLGNEAVERLYRLAEVVRAKGRPIAVHLFPARMEGASWPKFAAAHPEHAAFWQELQPAYDYFQRHRQLPRITVSPQGAYQVAGPP